MVKTKFFKRIAILFSYLLNIHFIQLRLSRFIEHLIYEKTKKPKPKWVTILSWKCIFYIYCVIFPVRSFVVTYLQLRHLPLEAHIDVDPVLTTLVIHFHFFNIFTTAATGLLGIFAFYVDYSICFMLDLYILKIGHDIIVNNAANFWSLNSAVSQKYTCKEVQQFILKIWNNFDVVFKFKSLQNFDGLSTKIRAKVLILSTVIEWVNVLFLIVISNLKIEYLASVFQTYFVLQY